MTTDAHHPPDTKSVRPPARATIAVVAGGIAAAGVFVALIVIARSPADPVGLSVAAAVVLGLVEGLTEYLPVSSTGHLLVANDVMDLGGTTGSDRALDAYAICIQVGAILAVLVLYRERIRQMVDGLLGRSQPGRTVLVAVVAAFVPTAILGFTLRDVVRDNLFGVGPVAAAWLVGGLAILALTRTGARAARCDEGAAGAGDTGDLRRSPSPRRSGLLAKAGIELDDIGVRHALLIGLGQAVALWPGVSRSLVTIVVGVLVGLSLRAAVEFSFLLGLVTLTAATVLTALDDGALLIDTFGILTPIIGLVVAFVAAVASVRWMVSWLERRSLDVFGWYRALIGVVAFCAIAVGWL